MNNMNNGKYAEIINEIATHVYGDSIKSTERRKRIKFADGNVREIDLYVITKDDKKIAFEVRDRKGKQSVDWIDQVAGKYEGSEFDKVWICTYGNCDLSIPAIKSIKYKNIGWRNISAPDKNCIDSPVFIVDALKPVAEGCRFLVNGVLYDNVVYEKGNFVDESDSLFFQSLYDEAVECMNKELNEQISNNYFCYKKVIDDPIFDLCRLSFEIIIPLVHLQILDYLVEEYHIEEKENVETYDYLVISKQSTIYLSNNTLTVNFGVFDHFREAGYIVSNKFWIDLRLVKERYGAIKHIKMIDIDGKWNNIPLAIYVAKSKPKL